MAYAGSSSESMSKLYFAPVVKVDAHQLSFKVNPGNRTDIAVENAGSGAEPSHLFHIIS